MAGGCHLKLGGVTCAHKKVTAQSVHPSVLYLNRVRVYRCVHLGV